MISISAEGDQISCRNDSDETVVLNLWRAGDLAIAITVSPRTEFRGNPSYQTHALLYAIPREELERAMAAEGMA